MEFSFDREDRILIELRNGITCEGTVKYYNEKAKRLSLKDIIQNPGNILVHGVRHFESHEIVSAKVLSSSSSDNTDDQAPRCREEVFTESPMKISVEQYNKILELQQSYRFINSAASNFYSAIAALESSDIVALCARDVSKGRRGRASAIALANETNIFVFDVEILRDRAFDKGLRRILESESIVKVVYDCRFLSDCLYHKHMTSLVNVRDVEAEDVIMVHQERGNIRKHTRPLAYLVKLYLGIQTDSLDESVITDPWKFITSSVPNQQFLANEVSFLLPLHTAIQNKYLQRFADASQIYNETVRNSDMYSYLFKDNRYVLNDEIVYLVKHKVSCRGSRH